MSIAGPLPCGFNDTPVNVTHTCVASNTGASMMARLIFPVPPPPSSPPLEQPASTPSAASAPILERIPVMSISLFPLRRVHKSEPKPHQVLAGPKHGRAAEIVPHAT